MAMQAGIMISTTRPATMWRTLNRPHAQHPDLPTRTSRAPPSRCSPPPRRWTRGPTKLSDEGFYCSGSVYVEGGRIKLLGQARTARRPWPRRCRIPATRCLWNWPCGWERTDFMTIWKNSASVPPRAWTFPARADGIVIARSRVEKARGSGAASASASPWP